MTASRASRAPSPRRRRGYAEAAFTSGEQTYTISISDTRDNPSARDKFMTVSDTVGNYPVVQRGKNGTMMLVGGRFQVRVTSPGSSPSDRGAWLEAVDTDQLTALR